MMKNILLVSWSLPPIQSPRSYKAYAILKGFYHLGYKIEVLSRIEDEKIKEEFPEVIFYNIPVKRGDDRKSNSHKFLKIFERYWNGLMRIVIDYPGIRSYFAVKSGIQKYLKKKEFDFCLSIDGPQEMHWAITEARNNKVLIINKLIADCGDPLTRNLPGFKVAPYFKIIEDWFCENVDMITVPVKQGLHYFKTKYSSKIRIVEHSLDFPEISNPQFGNFEDASVHFAYAGNVMPYQKQFQILLEFLKRTKIDFHFHIYGNSQSTIDNLILDFESIKDRIIVEGKVERDFLLKDLSKYSFLVYFLYPESTGQVPFKLIDYSFTGVATVGIRDAKDLNNFEKFLKKDFSQNDNLPDYKKYHYKNTVKKYEDLFRN